MCKGVEIISITFPNSRRDSGLKMPQPGGNRRLRVFRVRVRCLDALGALRGHSQDIRRGQLGRHLEGHQHQDQRRRQIVWNRGIQAGIIRRLCDK